MFRIPGTLSLRRVGIVVLASYGAISSVNVCGAEGAGINDVYLGAAELQSSVSNIRGSASVTTRTERETGPGESKFKGVSQTQEMTFAFCKEAGKVQVTSHKKGATKSKVYGITPRYSYAAVQSDAESPYFVQRCGYLKQDRETTEMGIAGFVGMYLNGALGATMDGFSLAELSSTSGIADLKLDQSTSSEDYVELTFTRPVAPFLADRLGAPTSADRYVLDAANQFRVVSSESNLGNRTTTMTVHYDGSPNAAVPTSVDVEVLDNANKGKAVMEVVFSDIVLGSVEIEDCGLPSLGLPDCPSISEPTGSSSLRVWVIGGSAIAIGAIMLMVFRKENASA